LFRCGALAILIRDQPLHFGRSSPTIPVEKELPRTLSRTEFDACAWRDYHVAARRDIDRNLRWGAKANTAQDLKYPNHGLSENACSMQLHGNTDGDEILKVVQSPTATPAGRRNAGFDQSDLDPVIQGLVWHVHYLDHLGSRETFPLESHCFLI
jgi:hypothetical protein